MRWLILQKCCVFVVRTFELAFDDVPYNTCAGTLAHGTGIFGAYYHWHLELLPRLATIAGFRNSARVYYINPTGPPEVSCSCLT